MVEVVLDHEALAAIEWEVERRFEFVQFVRHGQAGLEHRRDRHGLHRRARLVGPGEGQVLGGARHLIGVAVARGARQRDQFAGRRDRHDGGPPVGVVGRHGLRDELLGLELHVAIEAELDVVARDRCLDHRVAPDDGEPAVGAHLGERHPVGAGERLVVDELEAADAEVVDVDPAEHRARRAVAVGVLPTRLLLEPHPGEIESHDRLADLGVDLALQIHVVGRTGEAAGHDAGIGVEVLGQCGDHTGDVGCENEPRVGDHGRARPGDGQRAAVAVEEGTASGGELDPVDTPARRLGERRVGGDLQVHEPVTEGAEDQREDERDNANPPDTDGRADCGDFSGAGAAGATAIGHPVPNPWEAVNGSPGGGAASWPGATLESSA